jgi:hypothetical protein
LSKQKARHQCRAFSCIHLIKNKPSYPGGHNVSRLKQIMLASFEYRGSCSVCKSFLIIILVKIKNPDIFARVWIFIINCNFFIQLKIPRHLFRFVNQWRICKTCCAFKIIYHLFYCYFDGAKVKPFF